MKKIIMFAMLLSFIFSANALAQDDLNVALEKARQAVEQKDYAGALNIYKTIAPQLRADSDLLIEWARVYTYADNHKQAIALFKEVCIKCPQSEKQILRELADQYKWNDQLNEAMATYNKALIENPNDLTLLASRAQILVWQGYHRQGIARYKQILKSNPDNLDALEGLAFALHWDGQDAKAQEVIKHLLSLEPNRKEATKLVYQIKNSRNPSVNSYNSFTQDTNRQTVVTHEVRMGMHLSDATRLSAIYANQILRKKNAIHSIMSANRQGFGLSHDLSEKFTLNTFMYDTQFSKTHHNPLTTNTWLFFKPDDYWGLSLAYDRETFEDNNALSYKIVTNSPSLSVDLRPNRYWFFNAKYKRSYYSDDNRQNQAWAKAEYRLMKKPYVKTYYNYYYSSWGEPRLDHGYFNPCSIHAHSLGLYSGVDFNKKIFVEAQGSGGYEFQHKTDNAHKTNNHPTAFAATSLNYRLNENWNAGARFEYFCAWPNGEQKSYIRKVALLTLTYNFGSEHENGRVTSQPYRTGG